jgi:hypothetical protein
MVGREGLEFRVTKYDPAFRNSGGAYSRDDWTSIDDIGRPFSGVILTEAEYRRAEDAYVAAAVAFMREAGVPSLAVAGLENHADAPLPFSDGVILGLDDAAAVVRLVLREELWCRLEGPGAFIHLGYDFYMYIGIPRACPEVEQLARRLGLFVEPFQSPHVEGRRI